MYVNIKVITFGSDQEKALNSSAASGFRHLLKTSPFPCVAESGFQYSLMSLGRTECTYRPLPALNTFSPWCY